MIYLKEIAYCIFNECMEPNLCQHRTCNNLRFALDSDQIVVYPSTYDESQSSSIYSFHLDVSDASTQ